MSAPFGGRPKMPPLQNFDVTPDGSHGAGLGAPGDRDVERAAERRVGLELVLDRADDELVRHRLDAWAERALGRALPPARARRLTSRARRASTRPAARPPSTSQVAIGTPRSSGSGTTSSMRR